VRPAQQRLHTVDAPRAGVDDRLVVQRQFPARYGRPQRRRQFDARQRRRVHHGPEADVAVLAGGLRHVHRQVGVAQDVVGGRGPAARGDTDTRRDLDRHVGRGREADRFAQGRHRPVGDVGRGGRATGGPVAPRWPGPAAATRPDEDGELVPAEPGDQVAGAAHAPQPVRDDAQQLVAGGVAVAVVDRLEPVEVEHEDGEVLARRVVVGCGHLLQALGEQVAVGQAGERVVVGLVGQVLGRLLEPVRQVPCRRQRLGLVLQQQHVVDHGVGRGEVVEGQAQPLQGGGVGHPRRTDEEQHPVEVVVEHLAAQRHVLVGDAAQQEHRPRAARHPVERRRPAWRGHGEVTVERVVVAERGGEPAQRRSGLHDPQVPVDHEVEREGRGEQLWPQAPPPTSRRRLREVECHRASARSMTGSKSMVNSSWSAPSSTLRICFVRTVSPNTSASPSISPTTIGASPRRCE
jgi:hypothetical protein